VFLAKEGRNPHLIAEVDHFGLRRRRRPAGLDPDTARLLHELDGARYLRDSTHSGRRRAAAHETGAALDGLSLGFLDFADRQAAL
jgi:hypothetical protein